MNEMLAINRADPTRTVTIRREFGDDISRRMLRLKSVVRSTLEESPQLVAQSRTEFDKSVMQPGSPDRFDFPRSRERLEEFGDWLQEQVDLGVLEVERGPTVTPIDDEPWTNVYVRSSYQKGIDRAQSELNKAGMSIRQGQFAVEAAFGEPIHSERIELLFSRTFTELRGVTETMAREMRRSLAQSIAEGRNPRDAARLMNQRVDVSRSRARTIARTETIRAHHNATINEYRRNGVDQVEVEAEWLTAGDDRVCPRCARREGEVFTLDEIEGEIPLHPNCRCVALPVVE